jgi:hypothetical protein
MSSISGKIIHAKARNLTLPPESRTSNWSGLLRSGAYPRRSRAASRLGLFPGGKFFFVIANEGAKLVIFRSFVFQPPTAKRTETDLSSLGNLKLGKKSCAHQCSSLRKDGRVRQMSPHVWAIMLSPVLPRPMKNRETVMPSRHNEVILCNQC